MPVAPTEQTLAELLPGDWRLAATNLPAWLDGTRREPRLHLDVARRQPLLLRHALSYTAPDGTEVKATGTDMWRRERFVRRGSGRATLSITRWSVPSLSEDGSILVMRFEPTRRTLPSLDVFVREGAEQHELRALIAHACDDFALSPEDFGSLSWFARETVDA